ncbi:MAG: glycosyltransferase family 4 protein, partial [Nitrospirae bacterium]
LLYVGSLGPHKNVGTLVRVFRRLKQARRIPHQLVLCGQARWGREVVEATQDLSNSGQCVVLDFIPGSDVPHLYHAADAFAFLSLYEGFGLPPLEAMACGVPVVVSNAGSLPEVVGDAGLQVPPTDDESIEEAIYKVLTDADVRQEMRQRGRVGTPNLESVCSSQERALNGAALPASYPLGRWGLHRVQPGRTKGCEAGATSCDRRNRVSWPTILGSFGITIGTTSLPR